MRTVSASMPLKVPLTKATTVSPGRMAEKRAVKPAPPRAGDAESVDVLRAPKLAQHAACTRSSRAARRRACDRQARHWRNWPAPGRRCCPDRDLRQASAGSQAAERWLSRSSCALVLHKCPPRSPGPCGWPSAGHCATGAGQDAKRLRSGPQPAGVQRKAEADHPLEPGVLSPKKAAVDKAHNSRISCYWVSIWAGIYLPRWVGIPRYTKVHYPNG